MSVTIAGSRVLLTGATGGLGVALAGELAHRGARLILAGRAPDPLRRLAASLPGQHRTCVAELADPAQAAALAEEAQPVDVLIANAAVVAADRLEDLTAPEVAAQIAVNLTAPAVLAAALVPGMLARGRGHVVLVSSAAGRAATLANGPVYTASKWGLRGLGLQLREEWRATGVGVSVIYPGPVAEAGMFARAQTSLPPGMRAVTPAQVARATITAIERDRAEVVVADIATRGACRVSGIAPRLVAAIARRSSHITDAREKQANRW